MAEATLTCPRCFREIPLRSEVRFCPHCGLSDVQEAAADTAPLDLSAAGQSFRVLERIAFGSVCNIYRCRMGSAGGIEVEGVLKIARDARANKWINNEAAVLRALGSGVDADRFAPFIPRVTASFLVGDGGKSTARQANVLNVDDDIRSPADELYTLEDVRAAHSAGLDARDVAWIWRRLLSVLGFAHARGVVHGQVLPMHVLIEPREHKLVLVDWCAAVPQAPPRAKGLSIISGGHRTWYRREIALTNPPSPALDIALGARCMIELLGGDPIGETFPPSVDPAIQRHFQRCLGSASGRRPDAPKLLEDFDRLIEALWGPRKFRVLEMPPRQHTRA